MLPLLLPFALAQAAAAQSAGLTQPDAASPSAIVTAAPAGDWVTIAADDLLVMTLKPDAAGRTRRVVIQLMPAPFSQGWVANIRMLARARWWDGLSVNRVQDNYVAQWGDADGEDKARAKPLPAGLRTMREADYDAPWPQEPLSVDSHSRIYSVPAARPGNARADAYAPEAFLRGGWPLATDKRRQWPVHCYGMVGVGRNLSPDTGTGAELYAVIGHAPRHLDRNIALVGRVVEGIEFLSSLPRGTEALGFYGTPGERTPIRSIRLASDLPAAERPRLQYLSTESASFAAYAHARANRHDAFFIRPAGGADVCNVPVPVRQAPSIAQR